MHWKAPEFTFFEKSSVWYTASIVVALLIVLFAALQGNILFIVFTVIAEILVLYWARQEPPLIECAFGDRGLVIADNFYPIKSLEGFAFVTDHPHDPYFELIIAQKKKFSSHLRVLVPTEIVDDLFDVLSSYLGEIEYEESLREHIMKIIRF
ncbi:MAG: hypothetical protein R3B52_02995 [Candidatus Paceibacterota bacterium]